jgi:hypothetical protein
MAHELKDFKDGVTWGKFYTVSPWLLAGYWWGYWLGVFERAINAKTDA